MGAGVLPTLRGRHTPRRTGHLSWYGSVRRCLPAEGSAAHDLGGAGAAEHLELAGLRRPAVGVRVLAGERALGARPGGTTCLRSIQEKADEAIQSLGRPGARA